MAVGALARAQGRVHGAQLHLVLDVEVTLEADLALGARLEPVGILAVGRGRRQQDDEWQ